MTIRGNEGNDTIKTINPTGAGALNVEAIVGITLAGGGGNDSLSADAILIGVSVTIRWKAALATISCFVNEGDDTMWGGAGADTSTGAVALTRFWFQGGGRATM